MINEKVRQLSLGILLIILLGLEIYFNKFTEVSISFAPLFLFFVAIVYLINSNKVFHAVSFTLITITEFLILPIDRFFIASLSLGGIYYFLFRVKDKAERLDNLNGSIMRIYHCLMLVRKWQKSPLYPSFNEEMKDDLEAMEDHLGNLSTATLTWRQLTELRDEYKRRNIEDTETGS